MPPRISAKDRVCDEIVRIMHVYHLQSKTQFGVDSPGGLRTMADVWRLLGQWESQLNAETAEVAARSDRELMKFLREAPTYALRNGCRRLYRCRLCGSHILLGQLYHDGGHNRRAHQECVRWHMKQAGLIYQEPTQRPRLRSAAPGFRS